MIYAVARGKTILAFCDKDTPEEALEHYAVTPTWLPEGHPLRNLPDTVQQPRGTFKVHSKRKDTAGVQVVEAWDSDRVPSPPKGHRWIVQGGQVVSEPRPQTRREKLVDKLKNGTITQNEKDELLLMLAQ